MDTQNNEPGTNELKTFLKFVAQICFVLFVLFAWAVYDFGIFRDGTKELANSFQDNEKEFSDLETYAYSIYPAEKVSGIWFEINAEDYYEFYLNKYHLVVYPKVNPGETYKEIGGFYLEEGSPTLDSTLHYLGWTNQTLKQLQHKLNAVNCDRIRYSENSIGLYNEHLNSYDPHFYIIFKKSFPTDSLSNYLKPLSESALGKRTAIN